VSVRHRRRLGLPLRRDIAADAVRGMIADGTLKPGRLAPTGTMLAEQTGLSLGTCRQALRRLADQGILTREGRMSGRLQVAERESTAALPVTAAPVFPVSVTITPDGVLVVWPDGTESIARPPSCQGLPP
jgi:DNA-binding transcriptional MocR family regulator